MTPCPQPSWFVTTVGPCLHHSRWCVAARAEIPLKTQTGKTPAFRNPLCLKDLRRPQDQREVAEASGSRSTDSRALKGALRNGFARLRAANDFVDLCSRGCPHRGPRPEIEFAKDVIDMDNILKRWECGVVGLPLLNHMCLFLEKGQDFIDRLQLVTSPEAKATCVHSSRGLEV